MTNTVGPRMFLIYPGMSDFEEVEIVGPAAHHGYCVVRPHGSDNEITVSVSRLVDRETAQRRSSTRVIQRDGYTVAVHTVRAI